MKDELKAKFLQALVQLEPFEAQQELEDQIYESNLSKMLTLDTRDPAFALESARLRGYLDAIKTLQTTRKALVELARKSNRENHS